ncbi:aminoacetone oxidase family FAD-binding enzyme, partial [Salmonella enterica subsp. enterica serovar Anatum]|nr:aminoacetone oxidase family FAD-binding enzyme [Salmonella enterica subsp. enterica serovar Anatum]
AMISVRIPGGILPAHLLTVARDIAETWGNGQIHLTTRQKLAMHLPKRLVECLQQLGHIPDVSLRQLNVRDQQALVDTLTAW